MRRHDNRAECGSPVSGKRIENSRALPDDMKAFTLIVAYLSKPREPVWMMGSDGTETPSSGSPQGAPSGTPADIGGQPRRRRSRLAWWLTAFGVIAASSVLACCVGWVGLALVFGPTQTKVASEVEAIAQRMASLQLPPQFQPTWGWSADHSLFWLQIARFDHSAKRGLLLIGELHIRPMTNPHELEQLRQLIDESSPDLRLVTPMQAETRKLTVRGVEAPFEIVTGEDRASTTKMRQVTGPFRGQEGTVLLILQAEADQLTDDVIEALLTSLMKTGEAP